MNEKDLTPTIARDFAVRAHADQRYGTQPYVVHLDAVASIVHPHGDVAEVIAYLHDVVEDTSVSIQEIENEFGSFIANCVALLTDEPGETRQERKRKTYQKLGLVRGDLQLALLVKAADRLANVRACIEGKNNEQLKIYKSEHKSFREAVYRPNIGDDIWSDLDHII